MRSGRTTSLEQVSENNSRYLVTPQQFAKTYNSTPMYMADTTNAVKEEEELESTMRHVTFRTRSSEKMENDQRGQGRASDLWQYPGDWNNEDDAGENNTASNPVTPLRASRPVMGQDAPECLSVPGSRHRDRSAEMEVMNR